MLFGLGEDWASNYGFLGGTLFWIMLLGLGGGGINVDYWKFWGLHPCGGWFHWGFWFCGKLGNGWYGEGIGFPWYFHGFGTIQGDGLGLYQVLEGIFVLYAPKCSEGVKLKPVWKGLGALGHLWLMKHIDSTFSYDPWNLYFNLSKKDNFHLHELIHKYHKHR
jgi:hypothetical protein